MDTSGVYFEQQEASIVSSSTHWSIDPVEMTSSRARGQQGWAIRDVMMAMLAACLASTGIDSATVSAKTRLTLYHVVSTV